MSATSGSGMKGTLLTLLTATSLFTFVNNVPSSRIEIADAAIGA